MPRHDRTFSSSLQSSHSTTQTAYLPARNLGYGLLQPQPISISAVAFADQKQPQHSHLYGEPQRLRISPSLSARRHHRKTSSFGKSVGLPAVTVPAWSEVEAGLGDLRDKSYELGAGIGELGGQLCEKLPAVRGGVAFISTLRCNLQLSATLHPPSPYLHPIAPAPSPSPVPSFIPKLSKYPTMSSSRGAAPSSSPSSTPLDTIPPLDYLHATTPESRATGLRLIADSIAQQRQTAARRLIFSPVSVAILVAVLAGLWSYKFKSVSDGPLLFTTTAGIAMSYLIAVRFAVGGYISYAETVNWKWLGQDEVVVAIFGKDCIGAVAYRVEGEPGEKATGRSSPRKKSASTSSSNKVAVIRAWTIRRRERGRGVGKGLLEDVVRICLTEKGCADVRFATAEEERAGSKKVLPEWLARPTGTDAVMRKQEERAARTLRKVVEAAKRK